jgi:hypothetical protein
LVSPIGPPRVAHDEVVKILGVVMSPANSLNGMINLGRAVGIIINSLFVTSEAISASMKGD